MNDLQGQRHAMRLRIHSGCLVLAIPKPICRALGLTSGNYLSVRLEGEEIIVSRVNLGANSPSSNQHHRIPPGKHGNYFRQEEEAKERQAGE